ncbi:MAG: leucine-rich repeat domain-containing protein [Clostridia bacterium]|nr:leucine-rich repeat domain-containing protein [Clostridia bacterium]
MKRKILSFFLILILIFSAMPFTDIDFSDIFASKASAAEVEETFMWGDYECKIINGDEVEIVFYHGDDTEVIIPSEINGMPVTVIGRESFTGRFHSDNYKNNRLIESLFIPSSVKTIEGRAFELLTALKKVVFSEGLTSIKAFAFNNCSLLTEVELPDSLTSFDGTAFVNTSVEELIFGPNIEALKLDSFSTYNEQTSNVKKVTMTAKNNYILNWRMSLKNLFLKEIVCNGKLRYNDWVYTESHSSDATMKIEKIICNNGVDYELHLLLEEYFDSAINETDDIITYCRTKFNQFVPTIELPSMNEKESFGFRYYLNDNNEAVITKYIGTDSNVVIPKVLDGYPVTSIASFAFGATNESDYEYYDCYIPENLIKSITIPDTINHIGRFAFAGNKSLENINIPNSLSEISDEIFRNCTSLKNIAIPENITKIGYASFSGCESLESIVMNSVTEIGAYAFENCSSLENLEFSENLESIGEFCFTNCESIESVDLSNVHFIGSGAFSECGNLKKAVLNDEIEKLEEGVFYWCFSLCEVNLPNNLKTIGGWCFDSTAITEMVFPQKLETIEESAFCDCKSLKKIVLPESIESIWCFAFAETAINTLTIPKKLKNLGYRAFWRNYNLTTLYFYADNCRVTDHGVEYLPNDWYYASPFDECNIRNIYLGSDVTALSWESMQYGTFENCTILESVTIPDSVSVIGTAAFKNCTALETAVIPDSVTEIADDAFEGCANLVIYCSDNSYACAYATAKGITVSTFIIEKIPNQVYTGNQIRPAISVSLSSGKLEANKDFTVSYSNNINAGEARVKVTGLGDYSMFASTASFTIVTRNISKVSVAEIKDQRYTGDAIKPALTITDNGRYLKEGTDYKVYYYNNTSKGTAYVSIKGIGNYSGSLKTSFEITELDAGEVFTNWFLGFFTDFFAKFVSIFLNIGISR